MWHTLAMPAQCSCISEGLRHRSQAPIPSPQHVRASMAHPHTQQRATRRRQQWLCVGVQAQERDAAPWGFGFQMNERYLQWDDAAAAQLIKLHCCDKLSLPMEEVESRLVQLGTLVPDMVNKLPRMRADIILKLIRDPKATTAHLLGLRDLFPDTNVSLLVTRWPFIITEFDLATLTARLQEMRDQLPGVRVEALVDIEPQLLKVDIPLVLANIRRILPGRDPVEVLVATPQMVLDMQQAGMDSALDVEGVPSKANATQ